MKTLLATKGKMSQTFVEDTRVPTTLVKVGPCIVTFVKNEKRDGYWSVQLGYGSKRIKNTTKPLQGHLKGVITKDKTAPRFLREIKFEKEPEFKKGDIIKLEDIFKKGDLVSVTGVSKGKGFAGAIKRWGFSTGPRTHGQSDRYRAPGSIGQGTTPGRVWKGKKMAGRMGGDTVAVKNLIIVFIDTEKGEMALSGSVPGNSGGLLIITKLASGKLEELVQETPKAQVQQAEESETEEKEKEKGEKKESEPKKEETKDA